MVTSTNHEAPHYTVLLSFPLTPPTWYRYPRPPPE